MTDTTFDRRFDARSWITEKIFLGMPFGDYLRSLLTPGNAIVALILARRRPGHHLPVRRSASAPRATSRRPTRGASGSAST